jgi:hypothetical protein
MGWTGGSLVWLKGIMVRRTISGSRRTESGAHIKLYVARLNTTDARCNIYIAHPRFTVAQLIVYGARL